MSIPCATLNVPVQAIFTVTVFTISSPTCTAPCTTCPEPCTVNISITWKNTGGIAGQFEPAVKINNVRTGSGTTHNLAPDASYTEVFNVTNLAASGSPYTICPDPNP